MVEKNSCVCVCIQNVAFLSCHGHKTHSLLKCYRKVSLLIFFKVDFYYFVFFVLLSF